MSTWYYGLDTGSGPPFPSCSGAESETFYIGRIGGGLGPGDWTYWNSTTATDATRAFAFWDLEGGGSIPSGSTATEFGKDQADAFLTAWAGTPAVDGWTFFADIESGNPGWSTGTLTQNQEILQGFLSEIINASGPTLALGEPGTAGVYISLDNWNTYFGSSYTSSNPFVLWVAGTGSNCYTCSQAQSEWSTWAKPMGGYAPMIWQYLVTLTSCEGVNPYNQDADISMYGGFYINNMWKPTTA